MHLDCFAVKRDDLQCSVETKKLDGFKDLPVETQNHVTEQLPTAMLVLSLLFSNPTFFKWGRKIMVRDAFFFQILPNLTHLTILVTCSYLTILVAKVVK